MDPPGLHQRDRVDEPARRQQVRNDLFAERRQAYLWDRTFGDLVEIDPMFWCRNDAQRWLAKGWMTRPITDHYYSADPPLCMVVVRVEDEPPMGMPDELMETVQSLTNELANEPANEPHAQQPKPDGPKRRGGRQPSIDQDQIAQGTKILRGQNRMKLKCALKTLRDAGIDGSDSALRRLIVVPAYGLSE